MQHVLEVLRKAQAFLEQKGVPQARIDAEWLMAEALGCSRLELYLQHERPLSEAQLEPLRNAVRRRGAREPLQHILGYVPFCGLDLKCDPRALVPRPETEALAERLVERFKAQAPARVLDLGTGTGALALVLAQAWPQAEVVAVERSAEALSLARENAERNGLERVQWLQGNWFEPVEGRFGLIVSNPPYLTEAEWVCAEPEVRAGDPREALVAGEDGLRDLTVIVERAPEFLEAGGWLALETGVAHENPLSALAEKHSYARSEGIRDYGGYARYFLAQAPEN